MPCSKKRAVVKKAVNNVKDGKGGPMLMYGYNYSPSVTHTMGRAFSNFGPESGGVVKQTATQLAKIKSNIITNKQLLNQIQQNASKTLHPINAAMDKAGAAIGTALGSTLPAGVGMAGVLGAGALGAMAIRGAQKKTVKEIEDLSAATSKQYDDLIGVIKARRAKGLKASTPKTKWSL